MENTTPPIIHQTSPISESAPPPKPHQSKRLIKPLIIGVMLVILFYGFVFFKNTILYKNPHAGEVAVKTKGGTVYYPKNSPLLKRLTPTPSPTYRKYQDKYSQTEVATLTKNWTTCTNTHYHYSIKYPADQIGDYYVKHSQPDSSCMDFVILSEINKEQLNQTTDFRVGVSQAVGQTNPEKLFGNGPLSQYNYSDVKQKSSLTKTTISSEEAYRLDICCGGEMGALYAGLETDIIVPTHNQLYEFQLTGNGRATLNTPYRNQDTYELMVMTIEFLPVPSTTSSPTTTTKATKKDLRDVFENSEMSISENLKTAPLYVNKIYSFSLNYSKDYTVHEISPTYVQFEPKTSQTLDLGTYTVIVRPYSQQFDDWYQSPDQSYLEGTATSPDYLYKHGSGTVSGNRLITFARQTNGILEVVYVVANKKNLVEISQLGSMAGMDTDYFVASFQSLNE